MRIKIYGTGTSGHQVTKTFITRFLNKADVQFQLEEITDVDEFLKNKIHSVPTVDIDDEKRFELKKDGHFNNSLREVIQYMLKKVNYGNMPQMLIPVDFSDTSVNAFYFGQRLASELGFVVNVLHVYVPHAVDVGGLSILDADLEKKKKEELDAFVNSVDSDWMSDMFESPLIDKSFIVGFPGNEIVKISQEESTHMIVMGSKGATGLIKTIFGSVSTDVMKKAHCPVLVVPEHLNYKPIRNILYASNTAEVSTIGLNKVLKLGKSLDAHVHILHVNVPGEKTEDVVLPDNITEQYGNSITKGTVENQNVIEGIKNYAHEKDIDLIVMERQQRGIFDSLFHKSVTKEMSIDSDFPIMIIDK